MQDAPQKERKTSGASNDFAYYKNEQVFGTLYVEVMQAEGGDDVLDAVLKRFEAK
jgi:hypothetical protein